MVPGTPDVYDDLVEAIALADLSKPPGGASRPHAADAAEDELTQLRLTVAQLCHALDARVVIERAIGVLAERHKVAPRDAFERLRGAARACGARVFELAAQVVASAQAQRVFARGPRLAGWAARES